VAHIIVGRSTQPWWKRVLGLDVFQRLVRDSTGFDLHIVSFEEAESP
jgi:two-component system sensor histidine kinase KdpD